MSDIAIKQPTKSILKHTYSEEHRLHTNGKVNNDNSNSHIHNPSTWFAKFNSIHNRDDLPPSTITSTPTTTSTNAHRLQSFLGSLRKGTQQQQHQQQQQQQNRDQNTAYMNDSDQLSRELAPRQLRRVRFPVTRNISTEYIFNKNDDTHISKEQLLLQQEEEKDEQEAINIQTAGQLLSLYESICRNKQEPTIDLLVSKLITQPQATSLYRLDLTNQPLNRHNVSPLADIMCIDFGLKELVLNNCKLEDDAIKILMNSLLENDNIEQLGLANNQKLTTTGFKYIAIYIKGSKRLLKLDLSHNQPDKKSIQYILAAAGTTNNQSSAPSLNHLVLNNCSLKAPQLEVLAAGIRSSSIKQLSLRNNRITHQGALSIGVMLRDYDHSQQQQGLTSLWLDHNEIGMGNGVQYLAQALRRNQNLRRLSMRDCKIDAKGCTLLGEALKYNQQLETLDLGYNPQLCTTTAQLEGIAMLGQALRINTILKDLTLADTGLGTEATITLAECLAGNTALERLDISNNPHIDLGGCMAIAAAVKMNHTLSYLDLGIPKGKEDMMEIHNAIIAACTRNALNKQKANEQQLEAAEQLMQRPPQPMRNDSSSSRNSMISTTQATARLTLSERLAAVTKNANRRTLSRPSSDASLNKLTANEAISTPTLIEKPTLINSVEENIDLPQLIEEAFDDLGRLEDALKNNNNLYQDDNASIFSRCQQKHNAICLKIPSVTDASHLELLLSINDRLNTALKQWEEGKEAKTADHTSLIEKEDGQSITPSFEIGDDDEDEDEEDDYLEELRDEMTAEEGAAFLKAKKSNEDASPSDGEAEAKF